VNLSLRGIDHSGCGSDYCNISRWHREG